MIPYICPVVQIARWQDRNGDSKMKSIYCGKLIREIVQIPTPLKGKFNYISLALVAIATLKYSAAILKHFKQKR
jgi:hypothetical protein